MQVAPSFGFPHQNSVAISLLPHTRIDFCVCADRKSKFLGLVFTQVPYCSQYFQLYPLEVLWVLYVTVRRLETTDIRVCS
jgi:hypothetical protein